MNIHRLTCLVLTSFLLACSNQENNPAFEQNPDKEAIIKIHDDYLDGWKKDDRSLILSLFEKNARIQPSSLTPVEGIENLKAFWFPDDGSSTTVNIFESELLGFDLRDSLAIATRQFYLDFDYAKDSFKMGRQQKGISTTIYRKQDNEQWKIWRKMWTDIDIQEK